MKFVHNVVYFFYHIMNKRKEVYGGGLLLTHGEEPCEGNGEHFMAVLRILQTLRVELVIGVPENASEQEQESIGGAWVAAIQITLEDPQGSPLLNNPQVRSLTWCSSPETLVALESLEAPGHCLLTDSIFLDGGKL